MRRTVRWARGSRRCRAVLADAVLDHELAVPDVQVHPVPVDHQHRGISRVAGE